VLFVIENQDRHYLRISSEHASQLDNSLSVLYCYPELWNDRTKRQIQARNLRILLLDIEAHTMAIEKQKQLDVQAKEKAEEMNRMRYEIEYDGMSFLDNDRID